MRRFRMLYAVVAGSLLVPVAAGASLAWDTPLLSFGATYVAADGHEAVHRGVDIACDQGDAVATPISGEVTFAGRVPAASGGGTVLALSILSDGKVLTLLPLAEVRVESGAKLSAGQNVGTAAGTGDPSSTASHLHVGLKRGTVYLDPAPLLAPASAPIETQVAEPVAAGAHSVVNAAPAAVTPAPALVVVPSPSPAGAPSGAVPVGAAAAVPAAVPDIAAVEVRASAPVASAQIAPGVTLAGASGVEKATLAAIDQPSAQVLAREFVDSLPSVAASPLGLAGIAVAGIAGSLLLSLSVIQRRFQSNPPVSDRFGSMLQHLRAGDTLCGLTSCSGLLPSQSRGRLAQRR